MSSLVTVTLLPVCLLGGLVGYRNGILVVLIKEAGRQESTCQLAAPWALVPSVEQDGGRSSPQSLGGTVSRGTAWGEGEEERVGWDVLFHWTNTCPDCGAICPIGDFCVPREHSQWACDLQRSSKSTQNFPQVLITMAATLKSCLIGVGWRRFGGPEPDGAALTLFPGPSQAELEVPLTLVTGT